MAEKSILSPVSLTSFFDNSTHEARQANLYFYRAQTLDPISVFSDSTLRIEHAQPVATTGWGRVPPVYVGEIPPPGYRVRAFDQFNTLIEDLDELPGAEPPADEVAPPTPVTPDQLYQTGDIKLMWSNHANLVGWLECDGRTIGKAGSGASYSGDQVKNLYFWLWSNDLAEPNNLLFVSGPQGKGESAQGDWDGSKTLALPDVRGRFIAGLDSLDTGSGTPPTASMSKRMDKGKWDNMPVGHNTTYTTQKIFMLGATGGEDVHKLVVTELAVHAHLTIDRPGHTHGYLQTAHAHSITDPLHQHNMGMPGGTTVETRYAVVDNTSTIPAGMSLAYSGRILKASSNNAADKLTSFEPTRITWTDAANASITLVHVNYLAAGQPGYQQTNMNFGQWVAPNTSAPDGSIEKSGYWGLWSENTPRATDYFDAAQRGDIPHNTLPPFIVFTLYIKQ